MRASKKINNQSGAAMLTSVVFFVFISLSIIAGMVSPSIRQFKDANMSINSKKSFFLSESGVEDAYYRLIKNKPLSQSETLSLDSNTASITIETLPGNLKEISSVGDVLDHDRKNVLKVSGGDGIVFKYGTQAGQGGFVFQNNSHVDGNIYSNGNITGSNNAYVTGDAFAAGGSITNMRVGYSGTGDAHANYVADSTVTGTIYCQIGEDNNKPCDTSGENPEPEDLPIADENISEWKNQAESGGTYSGNMIISTPTVLGPKKIQGDLTIDSTLTLAGTIYVTGKMIINGGVELSPTYMENSGVMIADKYIVISNGVVFENSGTPGSYILILSESSCDKSMSGSPCFGNNAIDVSNNSDVSIVNAQKGTVYFSNNATVKEAVGNKIELKNNVGITYGSGIISANFTSGPSGSWVMKSWEER